MSRPSIALTTLPTRCGQQVHPCVFEPFGVELPLRNAGLDLPLHELLVSCFVGWSFFLLNSCCSSLALCTARQRFAKWSTVS